MKSLLYLLLCGLLLGLPYLSSAADPALVVAYVDGTTLYVFKDGKMAMEDSLGRSVSMRAGQPMETINGEKIESFSDMQRTVGAMVKFMPDGYGRPYHILRWYDRPWNN